MRSAFETNSIEADWLLQHLTVARAVVALSAVMWVVYGGLDLMMYREREFGAPLYLRGVAILAAGFAFWALGRRSWRAWWPLCATGVVVVNVLVVVGVFLFIHRLTSPTLAALLQVMVAVAMISVLRSCVWTAVITLLLSTNFGLWWIGAQPPDFVDFNALLLGASVFLVLLSELHHRLYASNRQLVMALEHRANIVEDSDDAIFSEDLHGRISSWNPAAERLFGYSSREMLGRPAAFVIPEQLRQQQALRFQTSGTGLGHGIKNLHTVVHARDGEEKVVSVSASTLHNSRGERIGLSQTVRDRSELHRLTCALNERDAMRRQATEASARAYWLLDERGWVREVNSATLNLTGCTPEAIVGTPIWELSPQETEWDWLARLVQCQREGSLVAATALTGHAGSLCQAEVTMAYFPLAQRYGCFATARSAVAQDRAEWSSVTG